MNVTTVSTGTTTHTTNSNKTYKIEMIDDSQLSIQSDDDDDDVVSTDGSVYGEADMMQISIQEDVANQLAAAGPVGVAAAAAIASSKKRKRPHSFETNPSVRKRQQNRLLRKLRGIIYEFTGRVGKQAVVLVATPGKPNTSYKVFGAKPLEDVVRNLKNIVMDELESALAQQAPPPQPEDPTLFELPPLIIDDIPTPVEKMTQAQLRAFIPLMLKYSTGRGKPGWGRESTRPPWWPKELPWANVRMDARPEDEKQKISWTHALRKIVFNCYKYHGREDLLPTFADEEDKVTQLVNSATMDASTSTSNNYTQTVLSTIQNADGTVSLIQVDPNNPIITLPDGTTAQVQGVATLHQGEGGATIQTVQSLTDCNGHENMTVDLTEATVSQDGQIYITAEDGQGYPVSVSNMITVPVSASMYQSMIANIQQLHTNSDGTVCLTPVQVDSNNHHNSNFQCYSIMSAPSVNTIGGGVTIGGSAGNHIIAHHSDIPPTTITTTTTTTTTTSTAAGNSRCQIYNPNMNNLSSQLQATAKFYIANANKINTISGCNNSNNNINNNNSNDKNHNNNNISNSNMPNINNINNNAVSGGSEYEKNTTETATMTMMMMMPSPIIKHNKRRKQSFTKTPTIKIEDNNKEPLINIHILDDDDEPVEKKSIKLEAVDNR